MKQKKFISDVLFVQGINILIKAIWILVIDRAVQDMLPPTEYGRYYSLFAFSVLFIIILDLGINNLNTKSVTNNIAFYQKNFFGFIILKLLLSLIFIIAIFTTANILGYSFSQLELLVPIVLFQIFVSINQFLRSNISAMHLFKLDGILAVADRLLVVIVCGRWLFVEQWHHMLTIKNFVMIQLIGVCTTTVLGFYFNRLFVGKFQLKLHLPNIASLAKQSLPYALLAALMALFTRIDAVMIDYMLDEIQADRYAMSYRLLDAGNMIAVLLSGMLLPMFTQLIGKKKEIAQITNLSLKLLVVPAILMAIILGIHAEDVLTLMYPHKIAWQSTLTFALLMNTFVSICAIYIYGTLLTAAGDLKFLNWLAFGSAVLNILLNSLLIPKFGIEGAAFATFLTQTLFALGCLVKSGKWRDLGSQVNGTVIMFFGLMAFFVVFYYTQQFFTNPFVHMALGASVALGFVVSGVLSGTDVLKLLSSRKTQNPSDN